MHMCEDSSKASSSAPAATQVHSSAIYVDLVL